MKRIIIFTISLCLVLGSVLPVYAATTQSQLIEFYDQSTHTSTNAKTWADEVRNFLSTISTRINTGNSRLNTIINALTDNSNSYILSNMLIQIQKLTHIADQIDLFLGSDGTTTITENWSEFTADMYKLVRFLAPVSGSLPGSGNSYMTLWDYVFYEAGMINQLWGGWDSYFSELPGIRTNTDSIKSGTYNVYRTNTSFNTTQKQANAHVTLIGDDGGYDLVGVNNDGTFRTYGIKWQNGTPLGNIALINRTGNGAIIQLLSRLVAYYNDELTTWEHSDLTQTAFTPKSLGNGLYRYLAYIQSDTANIDYNFNHALTNIHRGQSTLTVLERQTNAHSYLVGNDGTYTMSYYNVHGIESTPATITWQNGTPVGNLATIMRYGLQQTNKLLSMGFGYFDEAIEYDSWERVAVTNTDMYPTSENPYSFAHGVYTLLENIQKPIARLTYVHADDEDIKLKKQEENVTHSVTTNFFGSGSGAASASDFGDVASAAGSFKTNANTGASASGVWSVFDQSNYNWFSQTTANNLDTINNNRKGSKEYDTPLLDSYYDYMTEYLKEN